MKTVKIVKIQNKSYKIVRNDNGVSFIPVNSIKIKGYK